MSFEGTLRDKVISLKSNALNMSGSVLICTDYLPPSGGGVEAVVDHLASGLVDHGWDVNIFTLGYEGDYDTVDESITIFSADTWNMTGVIGLQSQISLKAFRTFGKVVRAVEPDLIHLHNRFFFTTLVAISWKATASKEIPLVTTLHTGSPEGIGGLGGKAACIYDQSIGRLIIRNSDWIIGVSNAVGQIAIGLGAKPRKVSIIRNAVDVERFTPSGQKSGKSVLYVGRLVRNTGPHILLEATPEILNSHPDAEIHLIGSGPMRSQLEKEIHDASMEKSVTLHGFIADPVRYFQQAAVFCRPSFSEGLPLTLLEAMATETPPVVTEVSGVPEVVTHGQTGLLLPPNDPYSVADAITELLADATRRQKMGKAAREYVLANHTWEDRTESVMDVYRKFVTK